MLVLLPFVPASLTIWSASPSAADAIFVFPGQVPERARCGAELYRAGVAPRVVFSGEQIAAELEAIGQPIDDATLNARIASAAGVPSNAEVILPAGSSTWEDALVLGRWMEASGARTVVAVTSPTHARRALYSLRLALGPLARGVSVSPCGDRYGWLWWTTERSLVRVTLEALKFLFYSVRHFLPAALGLHPQTLDAPGPS